MNGEEIFRKGRQSLSFDELRTEVVNTINVDVIHKIRSVLKAMNNYENAINQVVPGSLQSLVPYVTATWLYDVISRAPFLADE